MRFNPKLRRALLILGQLALAAIFLAAGYFKLRKPWLQFAASLSGFKLLPDDWLEPVARYLPMAEVALGVWILSGVLLRWSALAASLVLACFLSVLIRTYALGLQVDCGCFGSGEVLSAKTILRDSLMLVLSLAVTIGAFLKRKPASAAPSQAAGSPLSGAETPIHPA